MTARIWPADAVTGAPSYTGRYLRQVLGALVGGHTAARQLGGRSGLAPGTPSTTVSATSTTWTVTPHAGVLDLEAASIAGPYLYAFDANVTGSMTAANATNPRIDLISVQLSDPAESDGSSAPGVAVVYTTGTAAPSPVPPATPTRSIALAQINVPVSGGGSPTTTWVAPYMSAAGGITPVSGASQYPASSHEGEYVDDATYGLMRFDGTAWGNPLTMAWQATQAVATSLTNNAQTTIPMDTLVVNTTGVAIGGGSFRAPIAGVYMVSGAICFASNATGVRGGTFALNGSGINGSFIQLPNTGGLMRLAMPTILVTCAANDVISMTGFQNSGGSLNTGVAPGSFLAVVKL